MLGTDWLDVVGGLADILSRYKEAVALDWRG